MSKAKPQITTTTYEFPMRGPPEKKPLSKVIYDSETGHILGRTAKNWAQLFLFYTIFYTVLASLFTICLQGLFLSLDDHEPKWLLDESLIGTNPGLALRPLPDNPEVDLVIIKYNPKNDSSVKDWVHHIDEFLKPYFNKSALPGGGMNQKHCDFTNPPDSEQVCYVDVSAYGDCSRENGYGYNKSSPCLFIKLNKIYNWAPQFYNSPEDLPEAMPTSLKSVIQAIPVEEQRNQIWVSCDGLSSPDKEVLKDRISYPVGQGIPGYFYPYHNQKGYLSHLIPVKINQVPAGTTFTIECKVWAKNIRVRGGRERSGSVLAEITIKE